MPEGFYEGFTASASDVNLPAAVFFASFGEKRLLA